MICLPGSVSLIQVVRQTSSLRQLDPGTRPNTHTQVAVRLRFDLCCALKCPGGFNPRGNSQLSKSIHSNRSMPVWVGCVTICTLNSYFNIIVLSQIKPTMTTTAFPSFLVYWQIAMRRIIANQRFTTTVTCHIICRLICLLELNMD